MNGIPPALAQNLCLEISAASRHRRWYSAYAWWCWGCAKFSSDVSKRCFARQPDYRGCAQVNVHYARLRRLKHDDYQPNEF